MALSKKGLDVTPNGMRVNWKGTMSGSGLFTSSNQRKHSESLSLSLQQISEETLSQCQQLRLSCGDGIAGLFQRCFDRILAQLVDSHLEKYHLPWLMRHTRCTVWWSSYPVE